MYILGRIKLPKSAEVASLYIQCNEGATINYSTDSEIVFKQGGMVSTNSYFNSIYENYYAKYTVDELNYCLRLTGDFEVSIYREGTEQTNRELISSHKYESCQASAVKVKIPTLKQGRIYIEILCVSEQGRFLEGLIATDEKPRQTVKLAIITCTYKKEEYIKKTIQTIVCDKLLQTKTWQVFVVDNGQTLTAADFTDARVELITNRNVGGSGGFTRGLIEALKGEYDHFLFMDDDIELESESIYRLFALYEYASADLAIAGSMLDLYKKNVLYEAGALYGKHPKTLEDLPFSVAVLKHNLELQPTNLNHLLVEEDVDYGGFWFFAFSRQVVEKIGLPLPYFIKVDDMEFGLRVKQALGGIVAFPSIAVWHEPFYSKVIIWDSYYYTRNNLITCTIDGSLEYVNTITQFTKQIIFSLLVFEYNYIEMIVKAFEDYLKGPGIIKNNVPEMLHKEVLALSKSHKSQIRLNYSPSQQVHTSSPSIWKKVVSLLTLNGHLLPDFVSSDGEVFLWQNMDHAGVRSRAFRKKKVLLFKEENRCLFQNEIDKRVGIRLLTRWLKVVANSSIKWSALVKEWKSASNELTSPNFWQKYLDTESNRYANPK